MKRSSSLKDLSVKNHIDNVEPIGSPKPKLTPKKLLSLPFGSKLSKKAKNPFDILSKCSNSQIPENDQDQNRYYSCIDLNHEQDDASLVDSSSDTESNLMSEKEDSTEYFSLKKKVKSTKKKRVFKGLVNSQVDKNVISLLLKKKIVYILCITL